MSDIHQLTESPRHYVGIRRQVPVTELSAYFMEVLPKVHNWVTAQGLQPASMPCAIWHGMDMATGIADCQAGIFLSEPSEGEGEISGGATPGGELLRILNRGPYDTVPNAWKAIYSHAAALGRPPGLGYEIYVDDPTQVPAEELRTEVSLFLG